MPKSRSNNIETSDGAKTDAGRPKPSKADTIVRLLRGKRGASLEDLKKATGWQGHSVRGFLSGTVKKRMGLAVESEADKSGIRRYRIAASAVAAEA